MTHYICKTCGIQYAATDAPPEHCPICEDDRQYVNVNGQQWTTLDELRTNHHNEFYPIEPNLTGIRTVPKFAIGQTAHLIETPDGNFLWETNSLIDDATVAEINKRGGVQAIGISHPHFYDSMVEWSRALGDVPIYLHADNAEWVMRPDDNIHFWEGETFDMGAGLTIIRCGGHFPGSSVLHWAGGADGAGTLLTGDTIMVVADLNVTFMYSYPNQIPLNATTVRKIVAAVEPFEFTRIHSSWNGKTIESGGKVAVKHSMERYIAHITG